MRKKPRVRHLGTVNMLKGRKDCLNMNGQYFSNIFWSIWKEISSKNSVLVVSEILRLFVNILTPNDKYSLSVKASA